MKEFWKDLCKEELRTHRLREAALRSLPEEIALTRSKMTSIKSASSGSVPISGGGNRYSENLNNLIAKAYALEQNLVSNTKEAELTSTALALLSKEDRRILEVFYIDRCRRAVDRLCEELNADERTVWRKARSALERYHLIRHGDNSV